MFGTARWRLTVWFTLALGIILVVIGAAVYLTTRAALFDQVNSDLESRAGREQRLLVPRLLSRRGGDLPGDLIIGPAFTTGGYFYAIVAPTGEFLAGTPNVDPAGLADTSTLEDALRDGHAFADTESSEGDSLRVYVVRLDAPRGERFLMEVGRSTETEHQALRRLLLVLAGGLGGGLLLAAASGYLLSGRALRPIRAAMDSQRAFIGDASHELRTPLSVIRANAELLKRHLSEPVSANHKAVDDIISESDRLARLVSQMLTLAQADAGQAALSLSEVALDELADEVARSMRLLAERRGVSLETDMSGPVRLRGDGDLLRELMVILTDNAIKYTDADGKVRLEVRRASSGKATVRVSDTGSGIPADALPHIFDRFYRVDKARSREVGGAGLGLAIARWIAEAHGGSIRVESDPGVGTTFTVELPV
ncbi:MAG: HAMP domain-containing histidine kinase [Chloroflexi bacterium]|nr:HAMP domain-containing histidine kinase [Chloroflexota bacterium]